MRHQVLTGTVPHPHFPSHQATGSRLSVLAHEVLAQPQAFCEYGSYTAFSHMTVGKIVCGKATLFKNVCPARSLLGRDH